MFILKLMHHNQCKKWLIFVCLVSIIIITIMEKTCECRKCKKFCVGFPATYRNKCKECRLLEMRTLNERERLSKLGKRELELEHRRLQKKIMNIDDYQVLDGDISQSEHSSDKDFVSETPVRKRVSSLTSSKRTKRKDRTDSEGEESKKESSGSEESEFFLSRKEREELGRQQMKRESKKSKKRKQKVVEREGKESDDSDEEKSRKEREQKMKRKRKKSRK